MSPQCAHITRKRCIYHYRRRLPGRARGEVLLSLRTRSYREAQHLAEIVEAIFGTTWDRVVSEAEDGDKLGLILRASLRRSLDEDVQRRLQRRAGRAVYAHWWEPGDAMTAAEADLDIIRTTKAEFERAISENRPNDMMADEADEIIRRQEVPARLRDALLHGMMEVARRSWEVAELRTLGRLPVVLQDDPVDGRNGPAAEPLPERRKTAELPDSARSVTASALVEPFFERRALTDRTTHQVMGQERGTLRRFIEHAGDRPLNAYSRADVTRFLDALRQLPQSYGKSPKDRERSLVDITAEADARQAPRLADKTVKRHLSTLSQFFQLGVDGGHLTVAGRAELVENHRFRDGRGARDQRDAWTPDEIKALFRSPVWSGCQSPTRRAVAGDLVIRDARFWLPLLALFHGARLEEFADLYGRDIICEAGTWAARIVETEADEADPTSTRRRLKTNNATRVVPIHPEVIRLGFLDYVSTTAPNATDPLFPDLQPQGKDGKRGPRITRWFVEYRRAIGIYRKAVAMHAFRHTANTRLRDAITDYRQERCVNYLFGHGQGGGEGRERYDKGPGLKAVAETLSLLAYPEVDLRRLYP